MRYQVKQRLLSFTPRLDIANESGEPILEAVGRPFSLRADFTIQSLGGHELARVRQKLLSWRPRFEVTRGAEHLATITRRMTLQPTYYVEVAGGETLVVTGSFFELNYQVRLGEALVAIVSRDMWSIRDTYGIEVVEPRFDAAILATVVAIDAMRAQRKHAS